MRDPRIDKLADVLVNYSVHCQKGEKVLIEARGVDSQLTNAVIEKVFAAGGYPFADVIDMSVERAPAREVRQVQNGRHGLLHRHPRRGKFF